MSKYRRDDKMFRAQVMSLADAGLKFPTASAKLPAYVRVHEPPTRRGHVNLPGLIIGLIYGAIVGGGVVGIIAVIVGGVR